MMKRLLATSILATGAAVIGSSAALAQDGECGNVTIAEMNWASAGVLAQLDKIILEEGYGCDVELVTGDTVPTFASMSEKGEPDVAPELWINAVRTDLEREVDEGDLVIAAESLADGGVESWWVPKYIIDANPEIKTVSDALERPDLFPAPEDPSKGGVYNCPSGWACQLITGNLFKAHGAGDKGFELIDTGSAAGLDGSIANAFAQEKGWLGYYWAPTSILGKYEMVALDMESEHDKAEWDSCTVKADCADPKVNDWAPAKVFTVVTDDFAEKNAIAMDYLKNRAWKNETVNALLAWQADNQASNEDAAFYFLENNADVWSTWVSADVAEKVKAAL